MRSWGGARLVIFPRHSRLPGSWLTLEEGKVIQIAQGQRHRLGGLETWGVIAEIWIHNAPSAPSDENDIVRLAEDSCG